MLVVWGEFVRNNHDLGNIVWPLSWITKLSALWILDLWAPNLDTIGEILNGGFVMGIVEEWHRDQIVEFLKFNKATD